MSTVRNKRRIKMIEATKRLSGYYGILSLEDVLNQTGAVGQQEVDLFSTFNQVKTRTTDHVEATIQNILFDNSTGLKTTNQIVKKINDLTVGDVVNQQTLRDFCIIYGSADLKQNGNLEGEDIGSVLNDDTINKLFNDPNKDNPSVSVLKINSPRISLETNDTNTATIFFNGIPNVELAKIVPFVELQFVFNEPTAEQQKLTNASIYKFLLGNETVDINQPILGAVSSDHGKEVSGMEMFLSPQTLNDANTNQNDYRKYSDGLLDKFSSFMSIDDFEITVVPTIGLMSFKQAKMNLTLHDRSRLNQIASLIRPDLYSKTNLNIEYGWNYLSQDENASNSVYGDLLNGMRFRETYGISNSSFSMQDTGQVKIALELFTKGVTSLSTEIIGGAGKEKLNSQAKEIEEIQKSIQELTEKIFGTTEKVQEIRGKQILEATSDIFSFSIPTKQLKKEFDKLKTSLNKTNKPEVNDLIQEIEKLIGVNGNMKDKTSSDIGGKVGEYRKSLKDSIQEVFSELNTSLEKDPFLDEKNFPGETTDSIKTRNSEKKSPIQKAASAFATETLKTVNTNKRISLAKLLLYFVGRPLINTKQFDDIQFLFYPMNNYAGKAHGKSLAGFIIELDKFTEELYKFRCEQNARSTNLSLNQFIDFISDTVLDVPNAPSYGLQNLFNDIFDSKTGERTVEANTKDIADHMGRIQKLLKDETPNGEWQQPQIGFYIEAQPESIDPIDGTNSDELEKKNRVVLRIHVYDKKTSSYDSLYSILRSSKQDGLIELSKFNGYLAKAIAQEATTKYDLLEPINSADTAIESRLYKFKGNIKNMKNMFMAYSPYIIFGCIGSTIKNASLNSIQDPQLSTVNILRTFNNSELLPKNDANLNLPTTVIPSQLSVQSYGCPLVNFAQTYFIDFQTGTTADNFYFVNGVSHKFTPGEFTTNIEFIAQDTWGRYHNFLGQLNSTLASLKDYTAQKNQV